jgi:ribulose-5-phosphate 4-epimerase/fuculose-1-phosphate aldolase
MNEVEMREEICRTGRCLFQRGLAGGTSGNMSVRIDDGWLMTPTGKSLSELMPENVSKLDKRGRHISGGKPTKETALHLAFYEKRPQVGAVVHLHSTHAVAVSCLADLDRENALPPLTPYYVILVGTLPLIPYRRPGDAALGQAVRDVAAEHSAVLLANHGPVVTGNTLKAAVYALEELEETAKLYLLLQSRKIHPLTKEQVAEIQHFFPPA